MFLTVTTNLLAIVTAPLELKLILTVLVPVIIGVAANRFSTHIAAFVRHWRSTLTVISHTNLALIIWQTLSGAQSILVAQKVVNIVVIFVCGILQHVIYIIVNALAVWSLRLPPTEAIAVLIMASQKSAPVAVTVIAYIVSDQAKQGILSVPAIVGQLAQVFIGSALIHFLRRFVKDPQE